LELLCVIDSQFHERVFDFFDNVTDCTNGCVTVVWIHLNDYVLALSGGIALVGSRERSLHSLYYDRLR
jgi:hypothetical protein